MSTILDSLSLIIAGLLIFINVLALTYYWQLKEYRYDRMFDFLRFDDGLYLLFSPHNLLISALILASAGLQGSYHSPYSPYILFSYLFGALVIQTWIIYKLGLKRPQFTAKAIGIVAAALVISAALIIWIQISYLLPLITLAQIIIVSVLCLALAIPTQLAKGYYINKATTKIKNRSNLISIGITGSYGKSSTKEFIAQLLSTKNTVLKTPRNINTEIGVAKLILNKLQPTDQIFVAEMGAYKSGEIKTLAQMVQPQIGVITAINAQHLSLFGSIEKIKQTKAELVQNLLPNGTAILNGDDANCRTIGQELPATTTVHYYSIQPQSDASCKLINDNTVQLFDQTLTFSANLPAPYLIQNLLPALLTANLLGMTINELTQAIPNLTLADNTIKTYQTANNITVIDDSYNANPSGLQAALNYLSQQTAANKFIVTLGMLELGKESYQAHKAIAELIIKHNIHCFVTRHTTFQHFTKAAQALNTDPTTNFTYIENLKDVTPIVLQKIQPGDAILLANRVPQSLKTALKQPQS
ncbi:hypothetical protein COV81_04500 [Candidatus Peregrinibacteria bacterium CG11_big_fil_rev_8_21_14_0_20_41_10]|nr:MAG: hypothetical protein COV81_04500 [Candidatus Peregrinibacteria bacterium CG11_big_fil_rev_8_21_14_0_20_41_10]PJC38372.1 MAG: hypothetical protein CO045_00615 [Candidatus Peregrinibacteria bacterium CG_4_9_14_0_2_um_filter_41_14]